MEELLENLIQVPGMMGTLIVGKDGLVIAFAGDINTDPDFLGATMADFFGSAESMMQDKFEQGELGMLSIESEKGKFNVIGINESTFLVTIAQSSANLGLTRWETKVAAEKLREML
jgi:predicted regulator of Ras-like GTPase activity (Roadblock/LC7/MglB family)